MTIDFSDRDEAAPDEQLSDKDSGIRSESANWTGQMKRRTLITTAVTFAVPRHLLGQTASPTRTVAMLTTFTAARVTHMIDAFRLEMEKLGWREGQNVEYRLAYADGDVNRLEQLAKELVERRVDVIVVPGSADARAAQRATTTIPIVMGQVANPVENKFVSSLARLGGNITGVSNQLEAVLGKLIELLHQVVPDARRVAILLNEGSPSHPLFWAGAQSACAALGLTPLRIVASAPEQLEAAVAQAVRDQAQAIVVVADPMYISERVKIDALVRATRLPAAYGFRDHVFVGGLMSYAGSLAKSLHLIASYVDKILRGAKPGDLPVEQPTRFELLINLKTAKALGLTIPQSVLLRADEVIQ